MGEKCLTVVRLCHKSKKLLHPTGALQVVHRWPAGRGGGTNLFSKKACTPGCWHHIAVVRKQSQLLLYINGRKARTVPVDVGPDPLPYQLFAGGLPSQTGTKQRFKGELDELALYPRALNSKEIRHHYTMVRPPKPRSP